MLVKRKSQSILSKILKISPCKTQKGFSIYFFTQQFSIRNQLLGIKRHSYQKMHYKGKIELIEITIPKAVLFLFKLDSSSKKRRQVSFPSTQRHQNLTKSNEKEHSGDVTFFRIFFLINLGRKLLGYYFLKFARDFITPKTLYIALMSNQFLFFK